MALVTAQDFLSNAFRKCGQMRPGYKVSPELYQDGLDEWTAMFDSWQAERNMGFSIPQFQYNVNGPGSQQNGNGYLIGPTAHAVGNANDFQGPRPDSIFRANCVMTNVGTQPVYIPMRSITAEEWASLSIRQIPAINVTSLYWYNPTFPNGTFNIFPPQVGNAIELFTWPMFSVPANLAASYSAPPGYMDAVIYTLGERLWPMCTKQMMANKVPATWLAGKAYSAREKVKAVNRSVPTLPSDFKSGERPEGFYDSFVSYTGEPY